MKYKLSKDLQNLLRNNITFYREKEGLTQYALADILGVDHSYVSKVESGKKGVSIDFIFKFSQELGISMDTLFSDSSASNSLKNINAMLAEKSDKDVRFIEKIVKDILEELENR